ncbi:hypothetical protein [Brackiella oedipodis]|uniref:hypothetical protein n=1 Tax=Brackiella oedipodis TaxID=124225 RepID=UPI00048EE74B|nr:hypothetical protein [Brackiella oedipodis]
MKTPILFASLALSLSACVSANHTSDGYVKTIDQTTTQPEPNLVAECLKRKIQSVYPAGNMRASTANLYEGKIPSDNPDRPLARITVDGYAIGSGRSQRAQLIVYQPQPVDQEITVLLKSCL